MKATEKVLACVGGLDYLPEKNHIYFSQSQFRRSSINIYKLDLSKNQITLVKKIPDGGTYTKTVILDKKNFFRKQNV